MTDASWRRAGKIACVAPWVALLIALARVTPSDWPHVASRLSAGIASLLMLVLLHPVARPDRWWCALAVYGWLFWLAFSNVWF